MRIPFLLASYSLLPLASGQAGEPAGGLVRARAEFAAADRDGDGQVTFVELRERRIVISETEFRAEDLDRSGAWSRDEFTVQFRAALVRSGRRADPDLEAEVARIHGLRRARTVDAARSGLGPAAGRLDPAAVGATPLLLELDAKVSRALSDLEDRAVGRGAVREDFDRVRSAWNERTTCSRALDVPGSQVPDSSERFLSALETLEARARAGSVDRAEFGPLRTAWEQRPRRELARSAPASARGELEIGARFERALDQLEARVLARTATAEDWAGVGSLVVERVQRAIQGADPRAPAIDDPRVVRVAAELREHLARLEVRAREGALAPADFAAVRSLLPTSPPRRDPPAPGDRSRSR